MSHSHVDDASDKPVPKAPIPDTSSNLGSRDGCGPDLDGMCGRSGLTTGEQFKEVRDMLVPLVRNVANYESHIQTVTNSVVLLTSRITNVF